MSMPAPPNPEDKSTAALLRAPAWWSLGFIGWYADVHHAIIAGRWTRTDEDALIFGLASWGIVMLLLLRRSERRRA